MIHKKPLIQRMLDSMMEARARQAERYVDQYLKAYGGERTSRH
jgi:hypothetical protein